ncbi:hypothetical protein [Salininema proteolyticum]|uniref:Uncharacterized protein n=1 Tax=Salininema proteolyticum TaxID=1607685 RepID=A0ABV8U165_9ACTN
MTTVKPERLDRGAGFGAMLAVHMTRYFAVWFAVIAVGLTVVSFLIALKDWGEEYTVWGIATQAGAIFLAIAGGTVLYSLTTTTVAQGMTRREFTKAWTVFGLLWPPILAVITIAGNAIEYLILDAMGKTQSLEGRFADATAAGSLSDSAVHSLLSFPIYYLYFFSGSLMGALIYRWAGNATLPCAGVILVSLVGFGSAASVGTDFGPPPLRPVMEAVGGLGGGIVAWVLVAVIVVGYALAIRRILSDTPLRSCAS